jgi:hypothetical protein
LFGPGYGNAFDLEVDLWAEDERVSVEENQELIKPFLEDEVKTALFMMEKNKAAGPDDWPIEFYQQCWSFIKEDIMEMFNDFHNGRLDIKRLNYGIITLLPKVKDANMIHQFRPICLLNCLYKWFTKTLTIRLEPIAERILHKSQIAFIKGRNIMNSVLALHEILHETKRKKRIGVVLKLDFEKAYDKVSWEFLIQCLKKRGFNETWCDWVALMVKNGTVLVKLNGVLGLYFQSYKGSDKETLCLLFYLIVWLIVLLR